MWGEVAYRRKIDLVFFPVLPVYTEGGKRRKGSEESVELIDGIDYLEVSGLDREQAFILKKWAVEGRTVFVQELKESGVIIIGSFKVHTDHLQQVIAKGREI